MKLLYFSHGYYPAVGGAEKLVQQYAEGLASRGHKIRVLTTTAYNPEGFVFPHLKLMDEGAEEVNGVKITRISPWRRFRRIFNLINRVWRKFHLPLSKIVSLIWSGPLSMKMLRFGFAEDIDIIIATPISLVVPYYGFLVAKIKKIPFVLIPCFHIEEASYNHFFSFFLLRHSNAVIALTEYEKNFLISKGVKEDKIFTVGVGVKAYNIDSANINLFKKLHGLENKKTVSFIGQQSGHKGIVELIKAMEIVWTIHPNSRLIIAGAETQYSVHIKNTINSLSEKNRLNIIYLGKISEVEKFTILKLSDIFVTASGSESFGIVYVEAWSQKTPVIGTHSGAIPFVINDNKNGLLCRYNDNQDLANSILEVLSDEVFAHKLGQNGYMKFINNYTDKIIVNKIEDILLHLITL